MNNGLDALLQQKLLYMNALQLSLLTDVKTLAPSQIEAFRRDGHTLVKNILSPNEVAV